MLTEMPQEEYEKLHSTELDSLLKKYDACYHERVTEIYTIKRAEMDAKNPTVPHNVPFFTGLDAMKALEKEGIMTMERAKKEQKRLEDLAKAKVPTQEPPRPDTLYTKVMYLAKAVIGRG